MRAAPRPRTPGVQPAEEDDIIASRLTAKLLIATLAATVLATLALDGRSWASTSIWPSPPGWWMNSSYMTCVRIRESGNGSASTNLYGMMAGWAEAGGRGSAWSASRAEQHYRAWILWKRFGCHQPWGRYDGCC